jgi:L-lactate dehydrogenase complex protein LldG
MSDGDGARVEVLARIRDALGPAPHAPVVPRGYRHTGQHPPGSAALVELLVDRLEDYRATVIRTHPSGASDDPAIAAAIRDALAATVPASLSDNPTRADARTEALAAPGIPTRWLDGIPAGHDDGTLTPTQLDSVPAVITGSVVAIAETGTIVLDASPRCGRRALTLVPDVHVCLVHTADIVQTVPEALARLDPTRPLTFISGPSATSDIELNRVEGVHGPRTLVVVLVG